LLKTLGTYLTARLGGAAGPVSWRGHCLPPHFGATWKMSLDVGQAVLLASRLAAGLGANSRTARKAGKNAGLQAGLLAPTSVHPGSCQFQRDQEFRDSSRRFGVGASTRGAAPLGVQPTHSTIGFTYGHAGDSRFFSPLGLPASQSRSVGPAPAAAAPRTRGSGKRGWPRPRGLLRFDRRGIHAYAVSGSSAGDPGTHGGRSNTTGSQPHPRPARPRRNARARAPDPLSRHQALLARRRHRFDPALGRSARGSGGAGLPAGSAGHEPSGAAERAGAHR